MKKTVYIVLLVALMFMGLVHWGTGQQAAQTTPVKSIQLDETKQELARLKAEVERLTKFIKVTESGIKIEAPSITLNGIISLNYNGQGFVRVYSHSFFYGTTYGHDRYFSVF